MSSFEIKPVILPQPDTDITAYFNHLFTAGTQPWQQLAYELQREFRAGGSPDVRRIHIDRAQYNAGTATGSFRVVLDIDFTFGCEDVRTQKQDQTSVWSFTVDAGKGIIRFEGSPYAEARTTADEF